MIARRIFDEYEILALATNKKYRRKGVATDLLVCLLQSAKKDKIKKIFLEVSVKNLSAIKMYKKFGFYKAGERKNYYKTSEEMRDAYIMIKLID